ncbi:ferredoxin [Micromonospora auratinigra]|uniref:Ferredoxin n=1 Tax=Micromonospora auratinigra TaxID=261654 RepID=A0A1A8ZIU3_9ACTN|nr:ferredoxin [Micromonospora auratinigra]SBT43758.1 ferredoxin [Micromonospora auratinigra]
MTAVATRWTVDVDREACIGTGVCAGAAPRQIEIRDGKAAALAPQTDPDDAVIDAADMCPMSAITVRDAASGVLLAPEE